ncbi:IGHMBP2 family helicase [bacterium (Candidatus Blackallbacteria) CG17_big_fil_post_rev_8_21_14_2_50_48_46]|uniref:IGHMBP2 family helicase n=1 Tax=bacterium (Candidatus Blackallbacteria) CG17_big_fil_post_rev_8_21_14_2_50_48_46 TaxID=2014261 RepID=A0A2M7FY53_9BACT|nr:MAG: IGHMBP2 family helicase [bacterium (Candidatus Blackallbacteria) CG18_big_fil_WC_8_21_14_2_50_49_26]PIW14208.1 MAG: IGHMBP2 family helicase [bacterium (Candidatus Blackallbacteria) CG17_big_fil_post_rev_8_21_14_2_50_48_46]PIW46749.1 MAG: IGHMBP2 family helicase [bacterium (Candidatus Blackallbacteria) CG13_big_fil_rev_8_21_14_2_50_49_14]
MHPEDLLSEWLQLLKIEESTEKEAYQKQVLETPLKLRKAQGTCWYPVVIKHTEIGFGQNLVLELERTTELDKPHSFQNGQILALFSQTHTQQTPLTGVASSVSKNKLKWVYSGEELPDWLDDGKLGLDLCYDETTYREMRRAVERLIGAQKSPLKQLREVLFGVVSPIAYPRSQFADPSLNPAQTAAVQKVLEAEDLALIHGPPGTGKTTTLIAAISAVLKLEEQVLVSAPSNTATDLLCLKLSQAGVSVVRLGHPARMSEEILAFTLEQQISQHPGYPALELLRKEARLLRQRALRFKRNFGPAERAQRREELQDARKMLAQAREMEQGIVNHILDRSQAILCTLVGASYEVLWKRHFNTVFIDEAAQALLGGSLIPIQRARRVVLAGDHCQLPPTVKSQRALAGGFNRTLFEICIEEHPQAAALLNIQYRMHEEIMGFSSQEFYQGQLLADPLVAERTLPENSEQAWISRPLEFLDTAGCGHEEEMNPETRSLSNSGEAELLIKHLFQLGEGLPRLETEAERLTLGIISPYREQVNLLQSLLEKRPEIQEFFQISIDTVDGFQGQERDLIYISLVRSNDQGEIGFLKDTRRMNVAMTRAKKKLVVVGDSATLAHHSFYKDFLDYCEALDACRSGWEFF